MSVSDTGIVPGGSAAPDSDPQTDVTDIAEIEEISEPRTPADEASLASWNGNGPPR